MEAPGGGSGGSGGGVFLTPGRASDMGKGFGKAE